MVEIVAKPLGPYSLALSARLASDATRRFRDGVFTARYADALAQAWQSPDGTVTIRSDSAEAAEKLRWVLALDDDHSEFLRRFRRRPAHRPRDRPPARAAAGAHRDGRAGAPPRGLRSAHRREDGTRARTPRHPRRSAAATVAATVYANLRKPPRSERWRPSNCGGSGCTSGAARRSFALCRSVELERLHDVPTADRRRPDRARARPRAVVGRRRLPRGTRPLRARARRRPRPRQVPPRRPRPHEIETVGDGRAARAVRRVGRPRERLPPHRPRPRPRPGARREAPRSPYPSPMERTIAILGGSAGSAKRSTPASSAPAGATSRRSSSRGAATTTSRPPQAPRSSSSPSSRRTSTASSRRSAPA